MESNTFTGTSHGKTCATATVAVLFAVTGGGHNLTVVGRATIVTYSVTGHQFDKLS